MPDTIRMTIEEALENLKEKMRASNHENLNAAMDDLKEMSAYLSKNITIALNVTKDQEISPAQLMQENKSQIKKADQDFSSKNSQQALLNNAKQQIQQANNIMKQIPASQQRSTILNPLYGSPQQQYSSAVNAVIQRVEQASQNLRQLPRQIQQNFMDDNALNLVGGQTSEQVIANREKLGVNPNFRWRIAMENKTADQIAAEQTSNMEQQEASTLAPQPDIVANNEQEQPQAQAHSNSEKETAVKELLKESTVEAVKIETTDKAAEPAGATALEDLKETKEIVENLERISGLQNPFRMKPTPTGK